MQTAQSGQASAGMRPSSDGSTLSDAEIARFDALAAQWWNPSGPLAPLHAMNPARVAWIAGRIAARFGAGARPALLDAGCGAGLAAEALAKRGFDVLGLDAAGAAIAAAQAHAPAGLALRYRASRLEELLEEGARFPVVTCLEVIEHIPDPAAFLTLLAQAVAPGGLLLMSTLNRTPRALVTAKWGAEYVLRLLPVGTHDWRAFLTPPELAAHGRAAGLLPGASAGLSYRPMLGRWEVGRDLRINYLMEFSAGA